MKLIFSIFLFFCFFNLTGQSNNVKAEIDSLIQLNDSLSSNGNAKESLQIIQVAVEKSRTNFGEVSREYAKSVYYFGRNLSRLRDIKNAEIQLLESKSIYDTLGETKHITYAKLLNSIGYNYFFLRKIKNAEKYYLKSDSLWRELGEIEHNDFIENLMHLGLLYGIMGLHDKGRQYNFQALKLKEKTVGIDHFQYARVLNNIGVGYARASQYELALEYWEEAIGIMGKTFGEESPQYAERLDNIGIVYRQLGKYEKSEEYSLKAKEILAKTVGKKDMKYGRILNSLGILYKNMGQYEKAIELYEESRSITPETTIAYINTTGNMGIVYSMMRNFDKAIEIFLETKRMYEEAYGEDHQDLIINLVNLGSIYRESGQLQQAETTLIDAVERAERLMGKENMVYAGCLGALGQANLDLENYKLAEEQLDEARGIWEKLVGRQSAEYIKNILSKAKIYLRLEDYEKAEMAQAEIFQLKKEQLLSSSSFLSDRERENFFQTEIGLYFDQIQSYGDNIEKASFQNIQYDIALLIKGNRLQANKQTLEFILQQKDPEALETYYDLIGVRRQLSDQYKQPRMPAAGIKMLEEKENQLEKDLARRSATFRKEQIASEVTHKEVKLALQSGEAAIEFVHYNYKNPKPTDSIMYAAVVLLPNAEHGQFIPLFEEKELEQLLQNKQADKSDFYSEMYSSRGISPKKKTKALSELVYNLLWKPLESKMENVETIYFSPTGLMHRMNLAALPISSDKILEDKHQMVQLSSTREIALNQKFSSEIIQQTLIMGGINYDRADGVEEERVVAITEPATIEFENILKRSGTATEKWKYLPGTEKEVKEIQSIFEEVGTSSQLYTSGKATEEIVKSIGIERDAPQVLHFATHGFFFPDQDEMTLQDGNAPVFKLSEHPMIRSGLVLAGGNHVWEGNEPIPDREDGILTAYEISQLNLTNTDLVVLSACETGLGDIKGSEGVFGLQRAFKIAGAKNLIMSLWQVPDEPTQDLMTTFYKKWLVDKMDISKAFSTAQKEMKKKYKDPFFWAGFVLVR